MSNQPETLNAFIAEQLQDPEFAEAYHRAGLKTSELVEEVRHGGLKRRGRPGVYPGRPTRELEAEGADHA